MQAVWDAGIYCQFVLTVLYKYCGYLEVLSQVLFTINKIFPEWLLSILKVFQDCQEDTLAKPHVLIIRIRDSKLMMVLHSDLLKELHSIHWHAPNGTGNMKSQGRMHPKDKDSSLFLYQSGSWKYLKRSETVRHNCLKYMLYRCVHQLHCHQMLTDLCIVKSFKIAECCSKTSRQ